MEIKYIRKLMTSHMVVMAHENMLSDWEERMISHANLQRILFAEYICEDGQCNLWYDITGKLALDKVLEEKMLDYDMLCHIMLEIYHAVEGLESILLPGESLLLAPETIFLDYEMQGVYLCYCPRNREVLGYDFLQLAEYMLRHLEHSDERAVELAYSIYEQAVQSGWSLKQLKNVVCLPYKTEEVEFVGVEEAKTEEFDEENTENIENNLDKLYCDGAENEKSNKELKYVDKHKWKRLDWYGRAEKILAKLNIKIPWDVRDILGRKVILRKKLNKTKEEERFVFEPEEEEEMVVSRPTVMLSEISRPPEGILRYEGNGGCKDLVMEKQELLIGSDASCEGWISSATVSRHHAKLTCVEDVYFLEDLNSSNGTYVGGELLNYKTKVSLQKNEVVIFADEKFRFI